MKNTETNKEEIAVPTITARRLRKVAAAILEEPRRIDMDVWLKQGMEEVISIVRMNVADEMSKGGDTWSVYNTPSFAQRVIRRTPPCGSIGCIAGWATDLFSRTKEAQSDYSTADRAIAILDPQSKLPDGWSSKLFYVDEWPEKFQDRLTKKHPGTKAYARVVADRIEHFILQGE